ncbi:MAG: hypothetical protein ABSA97_13615 [Verrucomicrobiia bacterium]|jgi:hypothetical protein
MSLRILFRPDQIKSWLAERNGTPARRPGSDDDLRIVFSTQNGEYAPITFDELIETMKFHHLVIMVDQEPGKTFYKFYQHS